MMRPMKLAGSELLFGTGCLEHMKSFKYKKVSIVIGGNSIIKNGGLGKVENYLKESGAEIQIIYGVEPDPSFRTVIAGAEKMKEFQPDLIVALGGGSVMDAAKGMWIYYENPDLKELSDICPPNPFPKLRKKAVLCCIPTTSGTASEVSRSIVISDDSGMKHGIGNMEMMPDIAICDPELTLSMPAHITAETGMDALTHALEAMVSKRTNYLSDILARASAKDIIQNIGIVYQQGGNIEAREKMLNASMVAGLAFTNVSLGIVHSMAHTLGGHFHLAHGLLDAIILPYIVKYNMQDEEAKSRYQSFSEELGSESLVEVIQNKNRELKIAGSLKELIPDATEYEKQLENMTEEALLDGCTKTNPIIPNREEMKELFRKVYKGDL